ncbi:MAG TPA: LuxR C-terminal-related transcriptional regulator [Dehalococcoidia bacterium]|nr:LuxR C-terminal-related transcriptional regulator [Dehalococcoidia bacterium]
MLIPPAELTPGETRVVRLIAEGLTNGEIADTLCISRSTVSRHVGSTLGKWDLANRTALAVEYTFRSASV